MKKLWSFLFGLLAIVVYFLTKYDIQEELRAKKDSKLDSDIKDNNIKIDQEKQKIGELQKPVTIELSPEEVLNYWNSKDKK